MLGVRDSRLGYAVDARPVALAGDAAAVDVGDDVEPSRGW